MSELKDDASSPDGHSGDKKNGQNGAESELYLPIMSGGWVSLIWFIRLVGIGALLVALDQLCFETPLISRIPLILISSCPCWAYAGLAVAVIVLILDTYIYHEFRVHDARLADASEVRALFSEARSVEIPEFSDPNEYLQKHDHLREEVAILTELEEAGWTEYRVLPLDQMLVDFLKIDDLVSRARSRLTVLEDFAQDSAYKLDDRQFLKSQTHIEKAIEEIKEAKEADIKGNEDEYKKKSIAATFRLRAELSVLLETLAEYDKNWAEGSTIIRALTITGVLIVPALIVMGLIPNIHPIGPNPLNLFNWGLLGASGALTAVLRDIRKSDLVEVGNTDGKRELWRAVAGAPLGFLAGVVVYFPIAGNLLSSDGAAIPNIKSNDLKEIALSFIWAITAGFSFERVVDRLRSVGNPGI